MIESEHIRRVKELPCSICVLMGIVPAPAFCGESEAHHIGDSSERSGWLVIPLCAEHHRGGTGFHGLGERAFNRMYKTNELMLLGWTIQMLAERSK